MTDPSTFVPLRYLIPWPEDLFRFSGDTGDELSMADRVGLTSFDFDDGNPAHTILRADIALLDEVALGFPGLDGFSLVFGAPAPGAAAGVGSEFRVEVALTDPLAIHLVRLDVVLRMREDLLRPVVRDASGKWMPDVSPNGVLRPFEIRLIGINLSVDTEGDMTIDFAAGAPEITIGAFTIGETGIVVEADQPISLHLSRKDTPPPGLPQGWRGVHIPHAAIHLPDTQFPAAPVGLEFRDCYLGSGGFSGQVDVPWGPGQAQGKLFDMDLSLTQLKMRFEQNAPVEMEIQGQLTLPFFGQPLGVDIGVSMDGKLTVALSAVQPPGVTFQSGMVTFEKTNLMRLRVDSLGFQVQEGVFTAQLSGEGTPLFEHDRGLDWPSFQVKELSIDSKGNVHLQGGWLNLPNQDHLKFYGFTMEIDKLGFGSTSDGGRWMGFSGAITLVSGMPAGASVEGLRLTWYENGRSPQISLNGVGIAFSVPNVLNFEGSVSYDSSEKKFQGGLTLNLISLDMEVDGKAVVEVQDGQSFFALYLAAEWPAGIPLWSTGLGLYGIQGLFALGLQPNKGPGDEWYGLDSTHSWYLHEPVGVIDLEKKWMEQPGATALGAGVTLGTIADNGHAFSGRMLLVIVFPGPVLLIEGKASLLQDRTKLTEDANFRALVVLDAKAGTFSVGLDARYQYGRLIDIHGSALAFFTELGREK